MRALSVCLWRRRPTASPIWLGALFAIAVSAAAADSRILVLAYSGSFGLDPNISNLERNLLGPGYGVTFRWGADYGTLANYLGQGAFDQVWLWDQEIGANLLNAADKSALSAWYAAHPHIALDSRTTGIRVNNDADETQLAHNIRDQFQAVGGGLWIGAGAAPQVAATANAALGALQSGLFTGTYENGSILSGLPGHPFLQGVDVQGLRFSEVGAFPRSAAPTVGPGGVPLQTVAWDAQGHPLITTNVPEPTVLLLAGASGLVVLGWRRGAHRGAEP